VSPNHPTGLIENTQVATSSARNLGFDLDAVDRQLFVPADTLAQTLGASVNLYNGDSQSPVLMIQKTFNWAEIPINTNILKIGKDTYELPGIAALIPQTGKVYIPQQAIELLKAAGM
jgi:alkaline phosphatase